MHNDAEKQEALTPEEQERLLAFMREDKIAARYYDEVFMLLNTGFGGKSPGVMTGDFY